VGEFCQKRSLRISRVFGVSRGLPITFRKDVRLEGLSR